MKEWKIPSKIVPKIGKYKCLVHKVTGEEVCFGKFGDIWKYDSSTIGIRCDRPKRINKHLPEHEKISKGEESIIYKPFSEILKWGKIVGICRDLEKQEKIANYQVK